MRSHFISAFVICLAAASATLAADDNQTAKPMNHEGMAGTPMTPELKKDMADMYQKMADCLRTDKSLQQCSKDAMTNCPVVQKTGHCPINEGMGPSMGKKMKHGMRGMEMGGMKEKPEGK